MAPGPGGLRGQDGEREEDAAGEKPYSRRSQVHPSLFTKAVLAASGAKVVIGEGERVVVQDGCVAGVAMKGRDGVVDADVVVPALGPWCVGS